MVVQVTVHKYCECNWIFHPVINIHLKSTSFVFCHDTFTFFCHALHCARKQLKEQSHVSKVSCLPVALMFSHQSTSIQDQGVYRQVVSLWPVKYSYGPLSVFILVKAWAFQQQLMMLQGLTGSSLRSDQSGFWLPPCLLSGNTRVAQCLSCQLVLMSGTATDNCLFAFVALPPQSIYAVHVERQIYAVVEHLSGHFSPSSLKFFSHFNL